jgi:hypothetical protein
MGVTATKGADTPLYNPVMPSVANVLRIMEKTEASPLAFPVWIFTLTRSKGCPTNTTHKPPTPPDRKDFRAESAVGLE